MPENCAPAARSLGLRGTASRQQLLRPIPNTVIELRFPPSHKACVDAAVLHVAPDRTALHCLLRRIRVVDFAELFDELLVPLAGENLKLVHDASYPAVGKGIAPSGTCDRLAVLGLLPNVGQPLRGTLAVQHGPGVACDVRRCADAD